MLLYIVTDEQLIISQIVKAVLICLVTIGLIFNVVRIIRLKELVRRIISAVILLALVTADYFILKEFLIESALLNSNQYVEGVTLGLCTVTGLGQGVEFKYEINGKTYIRCNTFYPISEDSITVPDGKYMIRYSEKYLDEGRIDFNKRVTESKK